MRSKLWSTSSTESLRAETAARYTARKVPAGFCFPAVPTGPILCRMVTLSRAWGLLFTLLYAVPAAAQTAEAPAPQTYQVPPPHILEIMDAPAAPSARISANQKWLVITERDLDYTPLAELAEPQLAVAGGGRSCTRIRASTTWASSGSPCAPSTARPSGSCSRRLAAAFRGCRRCVIQPRAASSPIPSCTRGR